MSLQKTIHSTASIAVGLLLSISMGCTTAFKLPETDGEMEEIYLLSYHTWGHHSLAFYRNASLVEFTYGDWELFALNKRDGWTAWKNMTFLTQGTLGRKTLPWIPGTPICSSFKDCKNAKSFFAPVSKSQKLFEKLQATFVKQISTEVFNEVELVNFVKYERPYWGFHNCNHELADWLEDLGGEISGRVFIHPDFIGGMNKQY